MKVVMINGSPNKEGTTYTALCEVGKGLEEYGVEWEILHVGKNVKTGCIGCGGCAKTQKCMYCRDDAVNEFMEKIKTADGYVFGTPVHFGNLAGNLKSYMDRLFFANGGALAYKPAAAVVVARRGGTTAALESIHQAFGDNNMPIVTSNYWNMHLHYRWQSSGRAWGRDRASGQDLFS